MNPKRHRPPMQIRGITDIGEGPHFVHIFVDGSELITEVNLNSDVIESVTVFEEPNMPSLLDEHGNPIGDEAQSEEQPPVERKDAGATPVVPAI